MTRLFGNDFILDGYHRVNKTDLELLKSHYIKLDKCLYLHSPSGSIGYWNMGNYQLFIDNSCDVPVVQKFKNSPRYYITAPSYDIDKVDFIYNKIYEKTGILPVITEVDDAFMQLFMEKFSSEYKRTKVGGEFIYDCEANKNCIGGKYRDMRYRFSKFNKLYPNIECRKGRKSDIPLLLDMLNKWNITQGKKYFRSTIGRDKRFLSAYIDTPDMLCNVLVDNKEIIGYCTMEKAYKKDYGILVSAKALPEYKEAGYYLWHQSFIDAVDMGIKYANAASSYGRGVKEQKNRWRPVDIVSTYNITKKEIK